MSKIINSVNAYEGLYKLSLTDIRDIEVMLSMLESRVERSIPAVTRILKKLDQPISQYQIVKTGLSSARAIPLV